MSQADQSKASVNLLENNGRIFFFQPDIGVIASDEDLERAYEKFLGARRAFWNEVENAGLKVGGAGVSPGVPARPVAGAAYEMASFAPRNQSLVAELGLFAAKFCIALAIIGSVAGVVVTRATNGIGMAIEQVAPKQVSLADVTRKSADIVKDIQSLSPQEKEELRRNVGAISRELEPIVDAWRNPPPRP